jgi:hypothetical protein
MVRRLVTQDLCDDCSYHELPEASAVVELQLAINGDKLRRVQLCPRCAIIWQPLVEVYQKMGQNIDVKPVEAPVKRSAAKQVKEPGAKELASSAKPAEKTATKKRGPGRPKLQIVCPLPHPTQGGGKQTIAYNDRNSHVDQCHHGYKPYEVEWEDPNRILKVFCTEPPCKRLGFTSDRGLAQHARMHRSPKTLTADDSTPPERPDE